jgi:hypothetical protein
MSRFADPTATRRVSLGACQCPGTPHEEDEAFLRWQLGASALARIGRAELDGAVNHDPLAAYRAVVAETVVSWNLLIRGPADDNGGKAIAAPITEHTIAELDLSTLKTLAEAADHLITTEGQLPNASGAPSAASPRGSASRTRTRTRKRGT